MNDVSKKISSRPLSPVDDREVFIYSKKVDHSYNVKKEDDSPTVASKARRIKSNKNFDEIVEMSPIIVKEKKKATHKRITSSIVSSGATKLTFSHSDNLTKADSEIYNLRGSGNGSGSGNNQNDKNIRKDYFGNLIKKTNKKNYKVTFLDQISEKHFEDVVAVESLKGTMVKPPEDKEKVTCCSTCGIY
jgi:hypothetical protein